jgi:hypothetical protein
LVIKFTLTIYNFPATDGTSLYIAAEDVNLTSPDAAIVTRPVVGFPMIFLVAIANAVEIPAIDA